MREIETLRNWSRVIRGSIFFIPSQNIVKKNNYDVRILIYKNGMRDDDEIVHHIWGQTLIDEALEVFTLFLG